MRVAAAIVALAALAGVAHAEDSLPQSLTGAQGVAPPASDKTDARCRKARRDASIVMAEAAHCGYDVIGLRYPNDVALDKLSRKKERVTAQASLPITS